MRTNLNMTWATVRAVHDVTPTIREFQLVPDGGVRPWTPGSHIDVTVLVEGRPSVRSYSLVGTVDPSAYRIAVKRVPESRGGSRYLWTLAPGARLSISEPKNFFELRREAPEYLLLAGGIGVTPLVSMARALGVAQAAVRMIYVAHSEAEFAFRAELEAALGSRLTTIVGRDGLDPAREIARLLPAAEAYVCGPIGLIEAAQAAWAAAGRPRALLRFETFGSSGHAPAQPFWVRLPRHGVEITVPPQATLLEALEAAGVDVLSDCKRGECGLCVLDVLELQGEIDHRDVFLSEAERRENRKLCACVSRAVNGGVVLDSAYRAD